MADRKQTPDLLGAVLNSKPTGKQVKQKARKPVSQHTIKTESKVKATYYLSQEAIDALEDAQYRLRRLAGENRARVSKSLIVELAVKMVLEDVEAKGDKSRFLIGVVRGG